MKLLNEILNESSIKFDLESLDWLPHQRICEIFGKGPHWAKGKIKEGKWIEGKQYIRDPDKQIWVSITGVKSWLLKDFQPEYALTAQASKSVSLGTPSAMNQSGRGSQTKQTSHRQPVFVLS